MIEKIVGFGDSWMWGDELIDPALRHEPSAHPMLDANQRYREQNCFLGRLSQSLGVKAQNFGWPGASLQSTRWCFLWWLQNETLDLDRCLVLVALTDSNRVSFYNPNHRVFSNDPPWHRFVHSAWVHSGNCNESAEWIDMVRQHMLLTDCDAVRRLHWLETALFFQGQASRMAGVLQFNTGNPYPDLQIPGVLWSGRKLQAVMRECSDRVDLFARHGHASEHGHSVIHDLLLNEIKSAKLA